MKIINIELLVSNYEETLDFYFNTLNMKASETTDEKSTFSVGSQTFTLINDRSNHFYYYHLAFNIPYELFNPLKKQLQMELCLSTEDGEDQFDFPFFDSHSFYFEDPAGNIIEYIAKKEFLLINKNKPLKEQVLGIGEVGFPSSNPFATGKKLASFSISSLDTLNDQFNFIGDLENNHFLILVSEGRRWFFSDKIAKIVPILIETDTCRIQVTDTLEKTITARKIVEP